MRAWVRACSCGRRVLAYALRCSVMSDLEAQVVFTDSSPEPQECSVDEGEESEEGDQVDGDAGHKFDRLRRAV